MNTIKRGLRNTKDNKLRVIKLIKYKYKIKKNEYNNDVDYGIHVYKHRLKINSFIIIYLWYPPFLAWLFLFEQFLPFSIPPPFFLWHVYFHTAIFLHLQ